MAQDPSRGESAPPSMTLTESPVATSVPDRPRRSGSKWLIIAVIVLLLLIVIGYVLGGAAAAGGPVASSESALKTAVSHNNTMADLFNKDPFKNVDFKSDNPDVPAARSAAASVKQSLSRWQGMVTGDRKALQQARAGLNGSLLTFPEQATLASHRHRVDAALTALGDAQQAIGLLNQEMVFFDPFLDVIAGFEAISKAADAKDLGGMQSQLTTTAASLQKSMDLAKPPALPAELTPELKAMQQLVKDLQALVAAGQSGNQAAIDKYSAALEADGKALDATDENAVDRAITALFKPLSDEYDRGMKIAAGG